MSFQYLDTSGNYTNLNTTPISVESLPASASTTTPLRFNLRGSYYYFIINTPGVYQIRACADSSGTVVESDENNCSSPVTITIVPSAPPSCTSYSCSAWGPCLQGGTQICSGSVVGSPPGCVGTPPSPFSQSCTYKKPFFKED